MVSQTYQKFSGQLISTDSGTVIRSVIFVGFILEFTKFRNLRVLPKILTINQRVVPFFEKFSLLTLKKTHWLSARGGTRQVAPDKRTLIVLRRF